MCIRDSATHDVQRHAGQQSHDICSSLAPFTHDYIPAPPHTPATHRRPTTTPSRRAETTVQRRSHLTPSQALTDTAAAANSTPLTGHQPSTKTNISTGSQPLGHLSASLLTLLSSSPDYSTFFVSDIAVFLPKRDVKLQPTNKPTPRFKS